MSSIKVSKNHCDLDFLALGALVHRLDPGVIPFRKARSVDIHVSGGEYNVAANLADCFGLRTAIATAMVDYGVGELVQARIREAGVKPDDVNHAAQSDLVCLSPRSLACRARRHRWAELQRSLLRHATVGRV